MILINEKVPEMGTTMNADNVCLKNLLLDMQKERLFPTNI
jgi:hypothetical protein